MNGIKQHIHLDPAAGDSAGGGAASGGSPDAGAASAVPVFDESKYVPREDFERIQSDYSEFRQAAEQRFQDYDSRLPKPAPVEKKGPPSVADFDFSKEGEFERFADERAAYLFDQKMAERDTTSRRQAEEQGYKQYVQSTQDAHWERGDSYRAANPDYDPNKSIKLPAAVALSVMESDYSAHIHHFLQKNSDKLSEIRKVAETNPAAAIRMVGRIEAQFENKADTTARIEKAVSAKPTRAAFGGTGAKTPDRSVDDILKEWRPDR